MSLTQQQKTVVKNDIAATPEWAGWLDGPDRVDLAVTIADVYNAQASPNHTVWKSSVSQSEIMLNGFDWARVDNLSIGKARIWEWMFKFGSIDPSKPNIRTGIDATWVGSAPDLAVRAAVYVHCKRLATRLEKLLSTGTGSDAAPATLGWEGQISPEEILEAHEQG